MLPEVDFVGDLAVTGECPERLLALSGGARVHIDQHAARAGLDVAQREGTDLEGSPSVLGERFPPPRPPGSGGSG